MDSIKHNLIAKSNSTIVAVTSTACFVVVFCLVASISLIGQFAYQNRVAGADNTAVTQLKNDIQASKNLSNSYNAFISTPTNIIGGNPTGTGPQDGNNSKIVLDSLPSTYDYPAMATSLENILTSQGVSIQSISGSDAVATQPAESSSSPAPQPEPFQVVVQGSYNAIQNVINAFERSVRPFQIQTIEISGDQNQLTVTITAQTYWQPAQNLNITDKVLK
ncbi:MAG: type 4a pilus biogenesis protein PilO [Candidatus Saccharimonadales bacterium]